MSHYQMNPQLNTANDGTAFREQNGPQPGLLVAEARSIVRWIDQQGGNQDALREGWVAIESKQRAETGDARTLAVAAELLAFAKARKAETAAKIESDAKIRAAVLAEGLAANRAIVEATPARSAWAYSNLRHYWQIGSELRTLSVQIDATRPTSMTSSLAPYTASAPIGNAVEAIDVLETLESNLDALKAAVASARANLKASS